MPFLAGSPAGWAAAPTCCSPSSDCLRSAPRGRARRSRRSSPRTRRPRLYGARAPRAPRGRMHRGACSGARRLRPADLRTTPRSTRRCTSVRSGCGVRTARRSRRWMWWARSPAPRRRRLPTTSWIDIDADRYWQRPGVELPRLYGRFEETQSARRDEALSRRDRDILQQLEAWRPFRTRRCDT